MVRKKVIIPGIDSGIQFLFNGGNITNDLTVRDSLVFTASEFERDVYVNNFSGSDSFDGLTPATAFFTEQKAMDYAASQASTVRTNINYAITGIEYNEDVIIPQYAVGTIRALGDPANPLNIRKYGALNVASLRSAFTHEGNGALFIAEGINFDNYLRGVEGQDARIEITGCAFTEMGRAVEGSNVQARFTDNGSYNTTFDGSTTFQIGIVTIADSQSLVEVSDSISGTEIWRAFNIQDKSTFILSSGNPLDILHTSTGLAPVTFFIAQSSRLSLSSDVKSDGNRVPAAGSDATFIFFGDGNNETFILGGTTMTLDNFDYRMRQNDQGQAYYSDDATVTWVETNVANICEATIGSIGFDETSTNAQNGATYKIRGFDSRYLFDRKLAGFNF